MHNADGSLELERSLIGRTLGGARLQPLCTTITILLGVQVVAQVVGATDSVQSLAVLGPVLVAVGLLTAVGVTARARVDEDAISWRYYLPHRIAWDDVEHVALAVHSAGVGGIWRTVEVRTRHRRYRITPACAAGPDRVPFGRALLAAAVARGVAVEDGWR